jgi:pimeloyl-ACP methyl ester carboxylesterase
LPFFSANDQEIYFRASGKGKVAILLVHGWYQSGSQAWGKLLPYLENDYRVFVPDLPGHGLSEPVAKGVLPAAANEDLLVAFIAHVKKNYRCTQVILAGHSYGAFAALRLATKIPDKIAGVAALAAIDDYTPYHRRVQWVLSIPRIFIAVYYRLQALWGLFPYGDRLLLYGKMPDALVPGRLAYAKIKNRTLSVAGSHAYMRSFLGIRVGWPAKKLAVPLLLIYGERDGLTPQSWAAKILPHFTSASVSVIADAGHNVQLSGAEAVAKLFSVFSEKCLRPRVDGKDGIHASRRP